MLLGPATRTIASGSQAGTYNLYYDAENRLVEVKKNSSTIAAYTYDGDGRQVKSVVNSVTTLFIGAHYQVEGGMTTKYYFAGGQRIAMRKNGTLTYMLSDQLGSTSLTTDASGNVTSELRYTAWGEVRYQAGTTPTKYTYTGQYSNTADFGLMFYNARWYDPYINHFTQPDSIVPGGVQGYDRYAYVNNNPVNGTDPSGHCIWDGCVMETIVLTVATATIVSETVGVVMFGTAPDAHGINNAKQYVSNSGDAMSTYTGAGIAVQSNYEPLTDIIYRDSYTSGFGKAQVSQNDLDNELGMPGANPFDPKVAVAAMQKRISLVTDMCNGKCSQTDIFIAAALAQNAGFKKGDMRDLVNSVYGTPNTSDPTKNFLPWGTFLNKVNNSYNGLMLRMFKNDVQALGNSGWYVPDIDWGYIDKLSKGGWRSAW